MKINSFNVLFFIKWKIHAILTLLGKIVLPTWPTYCYRFFCVDLSTRVLV